MKTALRIFAYLKQYPKLATAQLTFALLGVSMLFVFPKMADLMVREVIENETLEESLKKRQVWIYVGIALAAFFARDIFNFLRIVVNNIFEQRAIHDLRSQLYSKLQRLPLPWYDNRRTGDIMTRVAEDVPAMERLLIDGLEQGLVAFVQVAGAVIYLYFHDQWLATAAILPLPLLIIGALIYTKNARHRYSEVKEFTGDMNAMLNDNIAGIRQIKTFAAEEKEQGRFDQASQKVCKATQETDKHGYIDHS